MNVLVSGLVNTETTAAVRGFPVEYYPIDYPFFGIDTAVSGVAFNIVKAMHTLGDGVTLASMTGADFTGSYVRHTLEALGVSAEFVRPVLRQTPSSVVLYDPQGRRQIYCDLKDIQETAYPFHEQMLEGIDLVAACNINFNRPLLYMAKNSGKLIATDVHVLSDIYDPYNREFMEAADILFLSDENIGDHYRDMLWALANAYSCSVIVLGRGEKGAAMYWRQINDIIEMPAVNAGAVVNTVGAGDALFSGFLHYFGKGYDPVEALYRGQIFAAHKILANGAANGFVNEAEIEHWIAMHRGE